ncbi:MAG: RluA family pseudouridine synthase [Clostridiales bacterium]|nr:RluA family pseudouridine synthase [Clostridiales bacterium]
MITQNEQDQRLDKFLKKYLRNASLSHIYKLIRKDVKLNGKRALPSAVLNLGDELDIYISEEDEKAFASARGAPKQKRQFRIAYEDKSIIIVEKPFGLLTHGTSSEKKNTLANQVISYLIEQGEYNPAERTFSPAPVGRLDRNTTGLVIFGKNSQALKDLNMMVRERDCIKKYYTTIVVGEINKDLALKGKLGKDHDENMVSIMESDAAAGKQIETVARVVKKTKGFTLLEVELLTGRTHQIRAHLAHAGHPIIGDAKYGDARVNRRIAAKYGLTTHMLHAGRLCFEKTLPCFDYLANMEVNAALPDEFRRIKSEIFDKDRI